MTEIETIFDPSHLIKINGDFAVAFSFNVGVEVWFNKKHNMHRNGTNEFYRLYCTVYPGYQCFALSPKLLSNHEQLNLAVYSP